LLCCCRVFHYQLHIQYFVLNLLNYPVVLFLLLIFHFPITSFPNVK
jgi:hypothetical protein